MILEIAQIDVKPGLESQFEAGVAKAAPLVQRAKGCKGMAKASGTLAARSPAHAVAHRGFPITRSRAPRAAHPIL